MSPILENFSIDRLAAEAKHIERGSRFNGMIFGWLAVAILLLAAFLLLTNSVPRTPWKLVELIGIPVLYAWISWLYFRAVRKPKTTDWTLASRVESEIGKLSRQVTLYRKLPTHFLLPVFIIIALGVVPDLFDARVGEAPLVRLTLFLALTVTLLTATAWGLNRTVKIKLQPLLDKLKQLEIQLNQD